MLGAIYIGLSGLNAYSKGLQQVSGNVTNLNTTGFKSTTVSFNGLVGASDRGGLSLSGGSGGQSGQGVETADARLDFKQGEMRQTGRDLDLAVNGSGFLVLLDGKDTLYARTGSFEVDRDGFIVQSGTNRRLATLDSAGRAVSLSVDAARTNPPVATTSITFSDNLSSTASTYTVGGVRTFDKLGGEHVWSVKFDKDTTAGTNQWKVTVTDDKSRTVATSMLKFVGGRVDPSTAKLAIVDADTGMTVDLDFSNGVTSFSSGDVSTLRKSGADGHASGTVTSVGINVKGRLEIGYSNEQKLDLGAVAIADFRTPQSLEQRGSGVFAQTGAGEAQLSTSEAAGGSKVVSKQLEASNVDLSKQFGDLILIQRGFQASSQIVSVSNDMIQQLFGIRGQG